MASINKSTNFSPRSPRTKKTDMFPVVTSPKVKDSIYKHESIWISDIRRHKGLSPDVKKEFLSGVIPGLEKSKSYFKKYIQDENAM